MINGERQSLISKKLDITFFLNLTITLLERKRVQATCAFRNLKTLIDHKTVGTLHDTAVVSDNYTISQKRRFKGQNFNTSIISNKNHRIGRTESKPVTHNKCQTIYNLSSSKFDSFEKKSLTCTY